MSCGRPHHTSRGVYYCLAPDGHQGAHWDDDGCTWNDPPPVPFERMADLERLARDLLFAVQVAQDDFCRRSPNDLPDPFDGQPELEELLDMRRPG